MMFYLNSTNQHQALAYASAVTNIFDCTLSPPDRPAEKNLSYNQQIYPVIHSKSITRTSAMSQENQINGKFIRF